MATPIAPTIRADVILNSLLNHKIDFYLEISDTSVLNDFDYRYVFELGKRGDSSNLWEGDLILTKQNSTALTSSSVLLGRSESNLQSPEVSVRVGVYDKSTGNKITEYADRATGNMTLPETGSHCNLPKREETSVTVETPQGPLTRVAVIATSQDEVDSTLYVESGEAKIPIEWGIPFVLKADDTKYWFFSNFPDWPLGYTKAINNNYQSNEDNQINTSDIFYDQQSYDYGQYDRASIIPCTDQQFNKIKKDDFEDYLRTVITESKLNISSISVDELIRSARVNPKAWRELFEQINTDQKNTLRCSDCTTVCVTDCSAACSTACDGNCKSTCLNNCQDGCGNGCTGGCSSCSDCSGGCNWICTNNCSWANGCFASCNGNCVGGCAGCSSCTGCSKACNTTCTGCQDTCSNTCYSECFFNCFNTCRLSCISGCSNSSRLGVYAL